MTALLSKRMLGLVGFTIAFSVGGSIGAKAERPIGVASAVRPVVEQVGAPTEDEVKIGDAVFMNEAIKTGPMGAATVAFTDDARLTINAASRAVLSSFIFADAKRYSSATFHLAKGSFQFAPGHSESRAYIFKSPAAVLTVRGATFDADVTDRKTVVHILSGGAELCRRGAVAGLMLRKDGIDDVRERNLIAFSKAPPFVPRDDACHHGPQCLLLAPGDTMAMSLDDDGCVPTAILPLVSNRVITYVPPPPPVTPH